MMGWDWDEIPFTKSKNIPSIRHLHIFLNANIPPVLTISSMLC
jgi:hypothetical protein